MLPDSRPMSYSVGQITTFVMPHMQNVRGDLFGGELMALVDQAAAVAAMVIAMVVMLFSMGGIAGFVERHPSVKILALAFLLLIGVMLVAEGFGQHVSKGYIYFAMAFSLLVELLNLRYRKQRHKAVALHHRFEDQPG